MVVFMRGQTTDIMFTSGSGTRASCAYIYFLGGCIKGMRKPNPWGDAEIQSPGGCGNPIPGGMRKSNPRGMREHHPRGCCGNPGICLTCAQDQKSSKGLPRATHCTDRAQTSGNVTPTVELCPSLLTIRTKVNVRARRDVHEKERKKWQVYVYIYHTYSRYETPGRKT